jgi:proline dehydrogenase
MLIPGPSVSSPLTEQRDCALESLSIHRQSRNHLLTKFSVVPFFMLMGILRGALLAASRSAWLRDHATHYPFMRRAVRRFMPGETADDALSAARELGRDGMATLLTLLGENVTRPDEAEAVADHYVDVLDRIAELGLDTEISVKPTQLGLDLDPYLCYDHLSRLVETAAARTQNTVWIDMESSAYVDRTLDLYRRLLASRPNVGVCLQAYLYRTATDLASLLPLNPAIRLVKGAYLEPREIAYPDKADVDQSYLELAWRLLDVLVASRGAGSEADVVPTAVAGVNVLRVGFGTHDRSLIEQINAAAAERGLGPEAYEWQMLYGIGRGEQQRLVRAGYRVRVLISYGDAWYPWYMRRLAERPANLLFVARNLLAR